MLLMLLQCVRLVYRRLGVVLFALEMYSHRLKRERVVLNPTGFQVPDVYRYGIYGYVIASDKGEADLVSELGSAGALCKP